LQRFESVSFTVASARTQTVVAGRPFGPGASAGDGTSWAGDN
jgi:hypothetical protein